MKPHVRIVFREPVEHSSQPIPDWVSVIHRNAQAPQKIQPAVDALMLQYGLPFFSTHEFSPAEQRWLTDEQAAGLDRVYRLVLQQQRDIPAQLIRDLELIPEVVSVTPIQMIRVPLETPRALQPGLSIAKSKGTDTESRAAIFLPDAHRYTEGSENITVAVLDTGINLSHPELAHSFLPGRDFVDIIDGASDFIGDFLGVDDDPEDDVGHGTHVAGIIAARGQSMPKGVAPRCKILPVRVLAAMRQDGEPVGAGLIENIDSGIKWAVDQGADVINMSLGVLHEGGGLPHQEVVDYAQRKGVTIVAASGNDGSNRRYYPGAFPYVIAVGAINLEHHVSAFSTYGSHVSFVAPGENIYSTHVNHGYRFLTGTSHAAPFVAGAVAMLKSYAQQRGQALSDNQIKYLLKHSSDKLDRNFKHPKAGYGQLNVLDALRLLQFKLQPRSNATSARVSQPESIFDQAHNSTKKTPALYRAQPKLKADQIDKVQGISHV